MILGWVVVIPRRPLEEAAGYQVTMTVNGTKYDWVIFDAEKTALATCAKLRAWSDSPKEWDELSR